jgi:hypothetical protein
MAVLSPDELTKIRQECAKRVPVNYTKAQLNAAVQAVEDWFETNRSSLSAVINNATSPLTLTAGQKRALVAFWLESKFRKEQTE